KRKLALDRKFGIDPNGGRTRAQKLRAGLTRYRLALADLDDLSAPYFVGAGKQEHAQAAREAALLGRLEAFEALGRVPEASQQADKLLALDSADAKVYSSAALFFQRQNQIPRAVQAWQRAISLVETGKAKVRTS